MKWVGSWAAAQQLTEDANLPPLPGLSGNTLRQVVYPTLGGTHVRVLLSNEYGEAPLVLSELRVGRALEDGAVDLATDRSVLFAGEQTVCIAAGETRFSDPLQYQLERLTRLALTMHLAAAPTRITGHPGSRTTSYLSPGTTVRHARLADATTTDHWYFIAGVDVDCPGGSALVTLGDSLTDGRGSTTNGNDRWPDILARRLAAHGATSSLSVLNLGLGGNAVLQGGLGPTVLERFQRDVVQQRGVRWLLLLEGVNDIGASSDAGVAERLTAAYGQCIDEAHRAGVLVYGVPLLPFGASHYDTGARRQLRRRVNDWMRSSSRFDRVIDLEDSVRDPNDRERLRSDYHDGDYLHLNRAGYAAMAAAIDLALFETER